MEKFIGLFLFSFLMGSLSQGAIPQQVYDDCGREIGNTSLALNDIKEVAKNAKIIFCYNQVSAYTKKDVADLLQNKVEVGITLSRSAYTKDELVEMAKLGNLYLIVDSPRLTKDNLVEISAAGAQLYLVSNGANLSKSELLSLAQQKPYTLAVTSNFVKEDLKDILAAKVQLVIYTALSATGNYDLLDITKSNPGMVTVKP